MADRISSINRDTNETKIKVNINLDGIDYDAKFVFETVGYNLEGNELGAAFGLAQLKKLDRNIQIREKNFKIQHEFFAKHNKFFSNPIQTTNTSTGWLAYPVLLNEDVKFSRKEFQIFL